MGTHVFIFYFFIDTKYVTSFTLDTQKITENTLSTLGPTHETHKTHKRFFSENMEYIHTTNSNSPQTHDKIILNVDLRHKLSDNTDHFTRHSNFLLYNSDLYSSINMRVLSFTHLKLVEVNWLFIFLTIIDEIFSK